MKKTTRKKTVIILIIILAILAGGAVSIRFVRNRINEASVTVTKHTVKRGSISLNAIGSGKVVSANTKTVMPENYISSVKVKTGDYVFEGDPLAEYPSPVNGDRYYRSSHEGVVTSITTGGYDLTTGKQSVSSFTISGTDQLQLNITLSEKDIFRTALGQSAKVYIDALDMSFDGTVSRISKLGRTSGDFSIYDVTVEFENADERIYIGMSGSAKILVEKKDDIVLVRVATIIGKNGKKFVVSDEWLSNRNKPRTDYYIEVSTGLSDTDFVEITKGEVEGKVILIVEEAAGSSSGMIFRR